MFPMYWPLRYSPDLNLINTVTSSLFYRQGNRDTEGLCHLPQSHRQLVAEPGWTLGLDPALASAHEGSMNEASPWSWRLSFSAHRVKKLKETLVAVQQLDKNMSSLRTWLAHIESELAKPIVYDSCDSEEIQKKLNEQQVKCKTIEGKNQ